MSDGKSDGGYGRPPIQHRFKPGQSGNPLGRPKAKLTNIEDAVTQIAKPMATRIGDQALELDAYGAVIFALCKQALSGKMRALLEIMKLSRTLAPAPGTEEEPFDYNLLRKYGGLSEEAIAEQRRLDEYPTDAEARDRRHFDKVARRMFEKDRAARLKATEPAR